MKKSILALDVGFTSMGVVVLRGGRIIHMEVIKTQKSKSKQARVADDSAARCAVLAGRLVEIIGEFKVGAVVGELPSAGAQSAAALRSMGLATGVGAAVAEIFRLPVEWCTPMEGKLALTGKRNASKEQMMEAARRKFSDTAFPSAKSTFEHIADALGAYEALKHTPVVRLLEQQNLPGFLD